MRHLAAKLSSTKYVIGTDFVYTFVEKERLLEYIVEECISVVNRLLNQEPGSVTKFGRITIKLNLILLKQSICSFEIFSDYSCKKVTVNRKDRTKGKGLATLCTLKLAQSQVLI